MTKRTDSLRKSKLKILGPSQILVEWFGSLGVCRWASRRAISESSESARIFLYGLEMSGYPPACVEILGSGRISWVRRADPALLKKKKELEPD